ncbi:uncharacterized protein YneR [Bhargavaea ullalensis]|uniref:Uncharacterized protein YneR n=1 Tax=Bhargavaea ullalensis TaxID=1265685 RepID=A0ABV2G9A0_9BACL
MKIKISDGALAWFKDEMDVSAGDHIRFRVRYGGAGLQPGFSIGLSPDDPDSPAASEERDGVTFFVEKDDEWYFDGHDLIVDYDENLDEPDYRYEKA